MEREEIKKIIFDGVDMDKDGMISATDIREAAKLAKYIFDGDEATEWIAAFPHDGTHVLFESFKEADTHCLHGLALFLYIDKDHDGIANESDFASCLASVADPDRPLGELFRKLDTDGDGKISCKDFVAIYKEMQYK